MKYLMTMGLCVFLWSCNSSQDGNSGDRIVFEDTNITVQENTAKQSQQNILDNELIVPGKRLGKTFLGITADSLNRLLGKPDQSDAAMGKAWLTWIGKRDEHNNSTRLDVYITYRDSNMREKTVQQIHATSSYFKTVGGLHVYSSMDEVRSAFPNIKKATRYTTEGREVVVYDEVEQGIAFEAVQAGNEELCTGIIIHTPGVAVINTYISLLPQARVEG